MFEKELSCLLSVLFLAQASAFGTNKSTKGAVAKNAVAKNAAAKDSTGKSVVAVTGVGSGDGGSTAAISPAAAKLFAEGTQLSKQGRYDEAVDSFSRALSLAPSFASAYTFRGMCLIEMGRTGSGIDDLNKGVSLSSGDKNSKKKVKRILAADALAARGGAFRRLHRFADAEHDYDAAIAIVPDSVDFLRGKAALLKMQGRTEEAAKTEAGARALLSKSRAAGKLTAPKAKAPESEKMEAAQSEMKASRYRTSVRYATDALEINPQSLPALMLRSEASMYEHRFNDTISDCKRILKIEPANQYATKMLAEAEKYQRMFGSSTVSPRADTIGIYRIGEKAKELANEDKFTEAEEILKTQVKLYPHETAPYFILGDVYASSGNFSEATAYFGKVLQIDKSDKQAYINRARAYHALRRYDLELQDYDTAIKFDPHSPYFARHTIEELYSARAMAYQNLKNYKKAIADYDFLVGGVAGDDETLFRYRGDCYMALGDYDKALCDYNKSIALDQGVTASTFRARADLYDKMKKPDLALQDRKKATELSAVHSRQR